MKFYPLYFICCIVCAVCFEEFNAFYINLKSGFISLGLNLPLKYSNKNLTSQTIASNSTYPYFDFTFLKSLRANGATKYTPNKEPVIFFLLSQDI